MTRDIFVRLTDLNSTTYVGIIFKRSFDFKMNTFTTPTNFMVHCIQTRLKSVVQGNGATSAAADVVYDQAGP